MEPVLELKQVTHRFGQFQALTDINLQIFAGERVALVGSSGAGKSTLLGLLNGTLLPTEGEAWVFGQNLKTISNRQLRRVQRNIGTIYQQFHLVDNLAVIHNVNAGHLGRWSVLKALLSLIRPLEISTAAHALEKVGILEKIYERTDRLSGGQQQRVALARVLVQDPPIILADEPIASLDRELSREVMDLLQDITSEHQRTLVVSLHALEFARSHCQRMVGLRRGAIVFDAAPEQVTAAMMEEVYGKG